MGPLYSLSPGGRMCFLVASLSSHPWACNVPWLSAAYNFLNYLSRPWVLPVACCWLWGSEACGGAESVVPQTELGRPGGGLGLGTPHSSPVSSMKAGRTGICYLPDPSCIFSAPLGAGGMPQKPATVFLGPLPPATPETTGQALLTTLPAHCSWDKAGGVWATVCQTPSMGGRGGWLRLPAAMQFSPEQPL